MFWPEKFNFFIGGLAVAYDINWQTTLNRMFLIWKSQANDAIICIFLIYIGIRVWGRKLFRIVWLGLNFFDRNRHHETCQREVLIFRTVRTTRSSLIRNSKKSKNKSPHFNETNRWLRASIKLAGLLGIIEVSINRRFIVRRNRRALACRQCIPAALAGRRLPWLSWPVWEEIRWTCTSSNQTSNNRWRNSSKLATNIPACNRSC